MLGRTEDSDAWRLRGTARRLASLVGVVFAVAAVGVGFVERAIGSGSDSVMLENWSLVPQTLATVGLAVVAWLRRSRALFVVTILMALILAEEAFHVLDWLAWFQDRAGWRIARATPLADDVAGWIAVYAGVAVVGVSLLAFAYWLATTPERRVVRNLGIMLVIGGFFGGIVNAMVSIADMDRLTFVEELGESIVYAIITGYVAGLVYLVVTPRPRKGVAPSVRERP